VEFLQDGQALQHRLQAADPQQHASCVAQQPPIEGKQLATEQPPNKPNTPPIIIYLFSLITVT